MVFLPANVIFVSISTCRGGPKAARNGHRVSTKAGAIHSLLDFYHNPVRQQTLTALFRYVGKPAGWIA